jgi:hypothetical protein
VSRFGRVTVFAPMAALLAIFALWAMGGASVPLFGAAPAEVPQLSTFAPLDDLIAESNALIEDLDKALADEASYKRQKKAAVRDAYVLRVLAHAVSEHDKKNEAKWGANAAAVRDAAGAIAQAEEFADARTAMNQIKELVAGSADGGEAQAIEWNQLAPMEDLMPVVNRRNLLLRRDLRRGKPRKREESVRHATLIALFARTVREDFSDVENSDDSGQWTTFADDARDHFAKLATLLREEKDEDAKDFLKEANESCNNCHKKFRPDIE